MPPAGKSAEYFRDLSERFGMHRRDALSHPLDIYAFASGLALFLFFSGVASGTVTSFDIGIWPALLGGLSVVLEGSWFVQAMIISQPDFR